MSVRVAARDAPPLWAVAPFFLLAPLGLAAAGVMIARLDAEQLRTFNAPRVLAIVHALVLGWLTPAMFGAGYQLGGAVLGIRVFPARVLQTQALAHAAGVAILVSMFYRWNVEALHWAPALVLVSVIVFVSNLQRVIRRAGPWPPIRLYLAMSVVGLVATVTVGAFLAEGLSGGLLTVTNQRIVAHAHLGLVGWLALSLMGVSYQLLPMFMLSARRRPAFPRLALTLTVAGVAIFALAGMLETGRPFWLAGVGLMASGATFWLVAQIIALRHRARRRLDSYGWTIILSNLGCGLAIALGVSAAVRIAVSGIDDVAVRLILGYGAAGLTGWLGLAFVANSYKIFPFLVWNHRYRSRAGEGPVPLLSDLYSQRWAHAVTLVHVAAAATFVFAAMTREPVLMRGAGVLLAATGLGHFAGLAQMLLPRHGADVSLREARKA